MCCLVKNLPLEQDPSLVEICEKGVLLETLTSKVCHVRQGKMKWAASHGKKCRKAYQGLVSLKPIHNRWNISASMKFQFLNVSDSFVLSWIGVLNRLDIWPQLKLVESRMLYKYKKVILFKLTFHTMHRRCFLAPRRLLVVLPFLSIAI